MKFQSELSSHLYWIFFAKNVIFRIIFHFMYRDTSGNPFTQSLSRLKTRCKNSNRLSQMGWANGVTRVSFFFFSFFFLLRVLHKSISRVEICGNWTVIGVVSRSRSGRTAKGEGRRRNESLKVCVTGEQVDAWPFTCKHVDMDCRRGTGALINRGKVIPLFLDVVIVNRFTFPLSRMSITNA